MTPPSTNVVELASEQGVCRRTLPLTKQQERLWRFLLTCERSPTYTEMARHMGLRSNSGIARLVAALKRKGFVRSDRWLARSTVALDPAIDLAGVPTSVLAAEVARRLAV